MKNLLFKICLICVVVSSYSQRSGFGIHAGVNSTGAYDFNDGYNDDIEAMSGFQVGIRYNLKLGPLGLCPELNYTTVKLGTSTSIYEYSETNSLTLNYLSIPVVMKLYVMGFNVQFGAQVSTLIGGKYKYEGSFFSDQIAEPSNTASYSADIASDDFYSTINGTEYWYFEDMDIAGIIGIGLDSNFGFYGSIRSIISITTLENQDLYTDIYDFATADFDGFSRLVSVQMSVGYRF